MFLGTFGALDVISGNFKLYQMEMTFCQNLLFLLTNDKALLDVLVDDLGLCRPKGIISFDDFYFARFFLWLLLPG